MRFLVEFSRFCRVFGGQRGAWNNEPQFSGNLEADKNDCMTTPALDLFEESIRTWAFGLTNQLLLREARPDWDWR